MFFPHATFRFLFFSFLLSIIGGACSSQKVQVNPGAYVTIDGTSDGLEHLQRDFKSASRTESGIMLSFDSDVFFAINSSYLSEAAKNELDKLVSLLREYENRRLIVTGHTDATGTADYNLWLSEKRAESVKNHLVSQGIAANRFKVEGMGQTKPIAPNNTAEGRQKNRRVEVTIVD